MNLKELDGSVMVFFKLEPKAVQRMSTYSKPTARAWHSPSSSMLNTPRRRSPRLGDVREAYLKKRGPRVGGVGNGDNWKQETSGRSGLASNFKRGNETIVGRGGA